MDFDTFVTIVCFVGAAISYGLMRYFEENVYMTYKDQRVGGKKK